MGNKDAKLTAYIVRHPAGHLMRNTMALLRGEAMRKASGPYNWPLMYSRGYRCEVLDCYARPQRRRRVRWQVPAQ